MIKYFKFFENYNERRISSQLVEQFDDDFIEEWFKENHMMDAEEIIDLWPSTIFRFIDDDRYVIDFIDNEISSLSIEDFSEYDYKQYISNELMTDKLEKKIIKLYNKNASKTVGLPIETEYSEDHLELLTEKQLRKIIENENKEDEFVEYIIRDRYEDEDAKGIIENIYGRVEGMRGSELWNIFSNYVDGDELVKDWLDETDKQSSVEDDISNSKTLQQKLLEIDKSNALLLAELFLSYKYDTNISNKYKFQKEYIEEFSNKNEGEDSKAIALKFLHDNFGLSNKIEKEYSSDMWMVSTQKYNI